MGIAIYDCARVGFASKQVSWVGDAVRCVIPRSGYTPSLTADNNVGPVGPLRGSIDVVNRSLDAAGWLRCDMLLFSVLPVNEVIDNIVLHRVSDGLLLFNIAFEPINIPVSAPLAIVLDVSSPGLCRI